VFTRGLMTRNWRPDSTIAGITGASTVTSWARGTLLTGGVQPLKLPPGSSGFGYAMDPSDPRTWRRPVRWT
jgi:hypothetical protein